jgi:hypothetical protein
VDLTSFHNSRLDINGNVKLGFFVKKLLAIDPEKRLCAAEALKLLQF